MRYYGLGTIAQGIKRFELFLNDQAPDIIGLQEVSAPWVEAVDAIAGYGFIGSSRNGKNATDGEWCPILYDTSRFCYIDGGTFWLTSTPDTAGKVEGSSNNRICTWVYLYDKYNNERIFFANTHLDHISDEVRLVQVGYLKYHLDNLLKDRPSESVYITGNFNSGLGTVVYNEVTSSYTDTRPSGNTMETYIGSGSSKYILDYCFYKGEDVVDSFEILTKKYQASGDASAMLVSDHYAVKVVFKN